MKISRRNPYARQSVSFLEGIKQSFEIIRDEDRPSDEKPLRVAFSIGSGKGQARLNVTDDEFGELYGFLAGGMPVAITLLDAVSEGQSPAIVAARTISGKDGMVTFKVSDAKMSRTLKIPGESWAEFLEFLGEVVGMLPGEKAEFFPEESAA